MNGIQKLIEVNNIIGKPILTPDGTTLIPVSRLSFCFGGGAGEPKNPKTFGGSAAGVKIEPTGFLSITQGDVRLLNISPPAKNTLDRALDIVPTVIEKLEKLFDSQQ